jgi:hypothetical protein
MATKRRTTTEKFTAEERAAMKERARELKTAARGGKGDGEADVLATIAKMSQSDRTMAEKLHAIVLASAPTLSPRTWYGMPAYAKDGKVVCAMWPTAFALRELTPAVEARIESLVKNAVS